MKKFLSLLSVLASCSLIFAQGLTRTVKITSKSGEKDSLRVYEVERIINSFANILTTEIEYMIENRTNRILEGEFEFPLEEGESVTGYALDINGTMREGVVVEKEKGRQVFEEIVRRGIDPGLVEMTSGNNFKTRVYPVNANGVRHLRITVEKEIPFSQLSEKQKSECFEKVFTETSGKNSYFTVFSQLDSDLKKTDSRREPVSLTVYFDVSSSAKNRSLEKEAEFLKKYAAKSEKIELITFSNKINGKKVFGKGNEPIEKLPEYLKSLKFDGATCFDFDFSSVKDDEILIFSDGIENWGNFESVKSSVPVHTVNSSASANFQLLKKIAFENNGLFINLSNLSADEAVLKLKENPVRIIKIEYNDSEIQEVYPAAGTVVNEYFSVSGVLLRKSGTVKISLGRNGKVEKIVKKTISAVDSEETKGIQKIWAKKKIENLSADYEKNKTEIIELAKKHKIVTKGTSLIVLDDVSDYIRYGIEPPEDLKAEYDRRMKFRVQEKVIEEGIPRQVYTKFEEYKTWWNKTPEDFKKEHPSVDKTLRLPGAVRNNFVQDRMMVTEESVYETAAMEERVAEPVAPMMSNAVNASGVSAARKASADSTENTVNAGAVVTLKPWSSDSEYLSILKKTAIEKMYEKYLELKKENENSPSFYMEVSDYFAEEGLKEDALRIISNLAEINLENTDVLRALGYKLSDQGDFKNAGIIFEKLVLLRPEVPQFLRDGALAFEKAGEYQKAVDYLWKIAKKNWDQRYMEIQQTALNDMNRIIAFCKNNKIALDTNGIDPKLMQNFDVDLRIVLTWNTDDCDVDLWVTDPSGEKCYYGHKQTLNGGRMSRDFTQGYGPEEFAIKKAPSGKYKIEANYFGNRQQKILQPVTVQAEVYTNFGRPDQKYQIMTLQLKDIKQTFFIGEVEIK